MTTQATTSAGTGQKGRKKASPAPTPAPQAVAGAGLAEEQVQPQWVQHDAYQAFGVELMRGKTMIGLSAPSAFTPAKDPTYKWPMENLRDLAYFYVAGGNAFCAMGHPGTGKTAGVQQFHAALNLPLLCMSANPRTQAYHLIGRLVPNQDGGVSWSDGPVLMAARLGISVLIDEYNVIDPGEMTGLNILLEGRPYLVPETGELVVPRKGFRVYVTCNPKDGKGLVHGRHTQDNANDERFEYSWFGYLPPEVEIQLVAELIAPFQPGLPPETLAEMFVGVANQVRKLYAGESDDSGALDKTISTRVLRRWVVKAMLAQGGGVVEAPIHYGLERAWSLSCSDEVRVAVHEFVTQTFGGAEYISSKNSLHAVNLAGG